MNINIDVESSSLAMAALASPVRLQILLWLLDPRAHFPRQRDGDLVDDGVCVGFITDKVGLSQPTVSSHMKKMSEAGLVTGKRIGNWMFYKPDRTRLEDLGLKLTYASQTDPEASNAGQLASETVS
ncbi:metalloregulator ArsR/SmtB family transcription factor [uncultured Roseibium sp.]|jgi:ArsR family transcriptional regulator|uniref:ArsR/SmtB family transcription factor n=1 Tax=uncultured Roseibium sp. TaxID=1936171 RepID=UPI002634C34A|nr:metalloregulator ArsR/SmtB family transcription factor [uncultured Roseibium sp.]